MTQRTQIYLEPEQHRRVKKRAAELGVSMAEYMRSMIERDLSGAAASGDVSAIIDLGDSGGSDVARHKDEYVAAAIDATRRPRGGR
jgi:hypothetical protein